MPLPSFSGPPAKIAEACDKYRGPSGSSVVTFSIDTFCYLYMGASDTISSFNQGYNRCNEQTINFRIPFDYGRLATFETPDAYETTMDYLKSEKVTGTMVIGAFNDGRDGAQLHQFYWGFSTSTSYSCYIFCNTTSAWCEYPSAAVASVTWVSGSKSPKVLVANVSRPFSFLSYGDTAFNTSYLCEFGK